MADRYWVGGAGNWNATTTTHWSASSGGANGASVPTASDNVFFDAASGGGAITLQTFGVIMCLDLDFTGFTGSFSTSNSLTSVGTERGLKINGNMTTGAAMTWSGSGGSNESKVRLVGNLTINGTTTLTTASTISFIKAAGTQVLTTNGKTITFPIEVNSAGTTVQLADNMTTSYSNVGTSTHFFQKNIEIVAGAFDANSKNITVTGVMTFFDGPIANLVNMTITGAGSTSAACWLATNITCSGTFLATGNSTTNRLIIRSSVPGTARTITAATVGACTNLDLQDITGAGAGSWDISAITGLSGDCGGNSGITFTTGATQYWFSGTGNWNNAAKWFLATAGGGGAGRIPLPQDAAVFDASSFTAGSQVITINVPRIGKGETWTGATNTPGRTQNTNAETFGAVTWISGMTHTGNQMLVLSSRTNDTWTDGGATIGRPLCVNMAGVTLTLGAALAMGSQILMLASGTFATANYSVDCGGMTTSSGINFWTHSVKTIGNGATKAMNWGSSTITWTSGTSPFVGNGDTNFTLTAGTSLLQVNPAGSGGCILKCFHSVTFNDVTVKTPSGAWNSSRFIGGTFTVGGDLTITGAYVGTTPTVDELFIGVSEVGTTIVVTGDLTISGAGQQTPLILFGKLTDVIATNHITANGNITLTDVHFHNMTVGGSGTWAGTRIGDAGGSTGVTYSAPRTLYWIGDGGNWQDNSHWSNSSGGASATTYPLPQDLCVFDANSFTAGAQTVTVNVTFFPSMRWTGVSNSPTLAFDGTTGLNDNGYMIWCGNEYTFDSGMTVTDTSFGQINLHTAANGGTTTFTMDGKRLPGDSYWEWHNGNYDGDSNIGTVVFADNYGGNDVYIYSAGGGTSLQVPVGVTLTVNGLDLDEEYEFLPSYTPSHVIHGTIAIQGSGGAFQEYASVGVAITYAATTTGKILYDTDDGTLFELGFNPLTSSETMRVPVYVQGSVNSSLEVWATGTVSKVEKTPGVDIDLLINVISGARITVLIWDGKRGTLPSLKNDTGTTVAVLTLTADRAVSFLSIDHITVTGSLIAADCTDVGSNTGITFRDIKQRTYA